MPTHTLSEAELHTRAQAYAAEHNISYFEALKKVIALAEHKTSDTDTKQATSSLGASDASLDTQAKHYAQTRNVSYSEAIGAVCAKQTQGTNPIAFCSVLSFSESGVTGYGTEAVQALSGQLVEIFRAGRHTADAGQELLFSAADIQSIASGYNPLLREAPLVVGHPQDNSPAYGWVKGLQATSDGRLLMQASQIEPGFADMVKEGRFKKRSASFYSPQHPNNPRPGSWYLRHVGWLGAQQPAVAGLRDANF